MTPPWIALGWQVGSLTGWGTFGAGFCRSLIDAGHQVILPVSPDFAGLSPFDKAPFAQLVGGMPTEEPGWLLMPLGNGLEPRPQGLPSNVKVCGLCVFEDSGALDDAAVERLKQYDCLIAPSRWVQSMLQTKGLEAQVCHQGYDARVFFPDSRAPKPSRPLVFSGGKLEFRKGQDIVVDAFRRFRSTPEGRDAILVTCWDNPWPKTMDGIWLSGYVTGVPTVRHGKADIVGWLGVNGVPPEAVIDCGKLSQAELAQVMRQCTVGVFPSRAEGATNLVLVEALACGLPCIAVDGHGHTDVPDVPVSRKVFGSTDSVVQGCQLYRSTNGWSEADPESIARAIADVPPIVPCTGEYWSWAVRGPALVESILAHDRVAA